MIQRCRSLFPQGLGERFRRKDIAMERPARPWILSEVRKTTTLRRREEDGQASRLRYVLLSRSIASNNDSCFVGKR